MSEFLVQNFKIEHLCASIVEKFDATLKQLSNLFNKYECAYLKQAMTGAQKIDLYDERLKCSNSINDAIFVVDKIFRYFICEGEIA